MSKRRWQGWGKALVAFIVCVSLLFVFRAALLNALAHSLVRRDEIKPCDAIVVLAGDMSGGRLEEGIRLLKGGYGKYLLFWGGHAYWKLNWADLYLRQLKEGEVDPARVVWSAEPIEQDSTQGESAANLRLLKKINARSFILVTSDYHSARAASVYGRIAGKEGMKMYVHPSVDPEVKLEGWWQHRQSAKMVFLELQKTVWYVLAQ